MILFVAAAAFAGGYFVRRTVAEAKLGSAEAEAKRIVEQAIQSAEAKKRESLLEAKEEVHRMRLDVERELRDRRHELNQFERRLLSKEENLDKRLEQIEAKETALEEQKKSLESAEREVQAMAEHWHQELERLASMTSEEARAYLLQRTEEEVRHEMALKIKEIETEAREQAERKARNIVSLAIQRYAADHVAESTVSVVNLPNDEMKGRIIGREDATSVLWRRGRASI